MLNKNISSFYVSWLFKTSLALAYLGLNPQALHASDPHQLVDENQALSPLMGAPILDGCMESYTAGIQSYLKIVAQSEEHTESWRHSLARDMMLEPEHCHESFSLGSLEAITHAEQKLRLEWLLEINQLGLEEWRAGSNQDVRRREGLEKLYTKKATKLLIEELEWVIPQDAYAYTQGAEVATELKSFVSEAVLIAQRQREPLVLGRFIIPLDGNIYTLFDYVFDASAELAVDAQGEWLLKPGTYQKARDAIFTYAESVAKDYLSYIPKKYLGNDTLLASYFYELFSENESPRYAKERAAFDKISKLIIDAQKLQLDIRPLAQIHDAMRQKQAAVFERDIDIARNTLIAAVSLPALPLAIKGGALLYSRAGYATLSGSTASGGFKKVLADLVIHAGAHSTRSALITAAGALAINTSIGLYQAMKHTEMRGAGNTSFLEFMDDLIHPVVSAAPLIALSPILVPATAISLTYGSLYVKKEAVVFFTQIAQSMGRVKALGIKGSAMVAIKQGPRFLLVDMHKAFAKRWWNSWFKIENGRRVIDTGLIIYTGAMTSSTIAAEMWSRAQRDDPDQGFFRSDGSLNKESAMYLFSRVLVPITVAPVIKLENLFSRFVVWRAIDSGAIVIGASVVMATSEPDEAYSDLNDYVNYLYFDSLYGMSIGSLTGELERVVYKAIMKAKNQRKISALTAVALNKAFRLATTFPKTSYRNYFLDLHMGRTELDVEKIKQWLYSEIDFEVPEMSDEQWLLALEQFQASALHELEEEALQLHTELKEIAREIHEQLALQSP